MSLFQNLAEESMKVFRLFYLLFFFLFIYLFFSSEFLEPFSAIITSFFFFFFFSFTIFVSFSFSFFVFPPHFISSSLAEKK
jgi:hypothetical protein